MMHILAACPIPDRIIPLEPYYNGEELAGWRQLAWHIVQQCAQANYKPLIKFQELNSHLL